MPGHPKLALLAVLLAGCTEPEKDEAADAMPADAMTAEDAALPMCTEKRGAKVDACASFDRELAELPLRFTGEVRAITRPERLCGGQLGNGPNFNPNEQGYALTIGDGLAEITVTIYLPWKKPIVSVGDTVTVEYDLQTYLESAPTGLLTMRDEDGDLLFWLVAAYGFDDLNMPELSVRDGEPACMYGPEGQPCRDFISGVVAESEDSGDVSIALGDMADVGDFVVLHGDNYSSRCDGIGEPHYWTVKVAAVRGSRASLDARDVSE